MCCAICAPATNMTRTALVDPLRAAEDAVTVDSTSLTFDEVVEAILRIVADKTGGAWA